MTRYYLRIANNDFGFKLEGTTDIIETDIQITKSDYEYWKDTNGTKNFRLKEIPTGTGLFDYIEEYIPEVVESIQEPGQDEFNLDIEYRLTKLELGV